MFREKKNVLMALSMSFIPFFAFAEDDGYVRLTKNNSYAEGEGFATATWDREVEDPSAVDYLVAGFTFYTGYKEYIVPARSLTIGELGVDGAEGDYFAYYGTHYSGSGGLILAKGMLHVNATSPKIGGKITFTSPKSEPFIFYSGKNKKETLTFTNDVHAASDCGIIVHSGGYVQGKHPFELKFSGDACDFLGEVVVTSQYNSAGTLLTTTFTLADKATYFGGSIVADNGAVFKAEVNTSVGSIILKRGATLDLSAVSNFEVRDNLTLETGATLKTSVDCSLAVLNGLTVGKGTVLHFTAPTSAPEEATRYALLTLPVDSQCSLDDFILEEAYDIRTGTSVEMKVSDDGKTKTIYVTYYPLVTQTKNNKIDMTMQDAVVAETDGKYWSDGQPVRNGIRYQTGKIGTGTGCFATRYAPEGTLSFAGRSMRFVNPSKLYFRIKDYTIPYLLLDGGKGGVEIQGLDGCDLTLRSNFMLSGRTIVTPKYSGTIRLVGPISGDEASVLQVQGFAETRCGATICLDGDNRGFAGRICVTNARAYVKMNYPFTSLVVRRAENLGGPRNEFAYDALTLDSASRLEVLDSMSLAELTRGIFIRWKGRFLVPEDKSLAIFQQLTVDGEMYKEGSGTLALGGDLRFIDAEGTVTDEIPEDAAKRTFYVAGGMVKPLSAYVLDGLDIIFSNKTSKLDVGFVLDLNTADEELRTKGVCNVKSHSPLAFRDDNLSKKVPVYVECADETPADEYSFGVMTVDSDCAAALDLLELIRPSMLSSYKVKLDKVTEAGTVTLVANLKKYGFAISIR